MATKKKRSYKLLPGLYRAAVLALRYDELTLLNAFESLGLSYISQRPTNDWEWYFIAQHYRLPTRLLDWTENILAALYFALDDFWRAIEKGQGTEPPQSSHPQFDGESPSIWMLDGGTMNLFSHGEDTLYATPREELTSYLPRFLAQPITANRLQPDAPIALHPPRQTSRIIAQQGMFTLHGRDQVPLDTLGTGPSGQAVIKLGCITLDRSRLRFLLDELQMAGVNRLALFPDLESVAEHVKWKYRSWLRGETEWGEYPSEEDQAEALRTAEPQAPAKWQKAPAAEPGVVMRTRVSGSGETDA